MSCSVPESSQQEIVDKDKEVALELMPLGHHQQTGTDQSPTGDGCPERKDGQRTNMKKIIIGLVIIFVLTAALLTGVLLWPQSTESGRSDLYTCLSVCSLCMSNLLLSSDLFCFI